MDGIDFEYPENDFYLENEDDCNFCEGCGNEELRNLVEIEDDIYKCPSCGQLYVYDDKNNKYKILRDISMD